MVHESIRFGNVEKLGTKNEKTFISTYELQKIFQKKRGNNEAIFLGSIHLLDYVINYQIILFRSMPHFIIIPYVD